MKIKVQIWSEIKNDYCYLQSEPSQFEDIRNSGGKTYLVTVQK